MDQYTPEEIAEAEAFRERVRRMPGIVMHDNPERVHFVPEIWIEGPFDVDDLLRYDDECGTVGFPLAYGNSTSS